MAFGLGALSVRSGGGGADGDLERTLSTSQNRRKFLLIIIIYTMMSLLYKFSIYFTVEWDERWRKTEGPQMLLQQTSPVRRLIGAHRP